VLATVEDGRARRIISRIVPRLMGGAAAGVVVARALRGLVDGGRHQEVLGYAIQQIRTGLAAKEGQLRHAIEERVGEHGGRLVGWAVGATIARRVLTAVNQELDKMGPEGSELRIAVDAWAREEITRIEQDPERAAEIGAAIRRAMSHETVQAWLWDIWARLRLALEKDAAHPNGRTITFLESALADLGRSLAEDPLARERLQTAAQGVMSTVLPSAREQLADFIAGVVANWDTETITDRLELRVGKDLQYVRVNGTLVGFLIGGLVYLILRATFGYSL
jgi:uncharacterized membrane-anchored protein YjiN (DUF445 family)